MTDRHEIEEHDLGLAHDLRVMERVADRRFALRMFASAGTAAVVTACGGGSGGSTTASLDDRSHATATATPTPTPTPTATATSTTGSACIVDPTETGGPFPADGTNTASGPTSNVLTQSGVIRSDIRTSFVSGQSGTAPGVMVTLTLTLVNTRTSCGPLSGYLIYLWHCDRDGNYSLYDVPTQSYLRGAQVTNAAGQVTFTTIFPACYSGRYPHMHFEVFTNAAAATSGRAAILTSQLAMPAATANTVYASTGYSASVSRFAQVTISNDNVFGDNTAAQIAQQTPAFTGSVAAGYTATATIGVSV